MNTNDEPQQESLVTSRDEQVEEVKVTDVGSPQLQLHGSSVLSGADEDTQQEASSKTARGPEVAYTSAREPQKVESQKVEPGAVAVSPTDKKMPPTDKKMGAGDANLRDKQGEHLSLPREPNGAHTDVRNKNEATQQGKRGYAGAAVRPGAVAVPGPGDTAASLRPRSEIGGNAAPPVDSNFMMSKAAIANRGSTSRATTDVPDVASVEENPTLAEEAPPGSPSILESKAALARTGHPGMKARPGAYAVQGTEDAAASLGSQSSESGADATPAGNSSFRDSKTAIANRGSRSRGAPKDVPDVASVEDNLAASAESPSTLASNAELADRSNGVPQVPSPVSEKSLRDVSGAFSKTESDKSERMLSVPNVETAADPYLDRPPAAIPGAIRMTGKGAETEVPMAELVTDEPMDDVERQAFINQARLTAEVDARQHMMATAVSARVVDESEFGDKRKRRRRLQIALLALVVIVAAVVGGVVGGQGGSTMTTAVPSAAPTASPNNDFCGEASFVTGDLSRFSESLQNTTIETRLSCSSGDEIEQRGRWYEYSGNGLSLQVELLSSAGDETDFEILTGASCEDVACVQKDIVRSDPGIDEGIIRSSTVNFITEENATYYIQVFSTLDATSEPVNNYILRVSDNSACAAAYPINLVNSQTLLLGSTAAAGTRDLAPRCGTASSVSGGSGVWYTLVGSGLNIEASTCTGASFDTQISVFTGDCASLQCVTGNNDSCGTQSSASWLSVDGQTYYIFVHGVSADARGSFELSVIERLVIDTCEGAATLPSLLGGQYSSVDSMTPSTVQGSTIRASLDGVPACGHVGSTSSGGVWYTVKGSGGRMRAFLSDILEGTDFDARVSVFRGSCSSLECVEQDDSLRWNSIVDELYFIRVHGVNGSAGRFGLFVDLGNLFCSGVVNSVPSNGTILAGSVNEVGSDASTIDGLPACASYPVAPSAGLTAWFSVVGTGMTMMFSSCILFPVFDFAVYAGDCENLTCIQELQQGSNFSAFEGDTLCAQFVSWPSVKEQIYYVRGETPNRNRTGFVKKYSIRVT